jgi:glycosyltransferase involved in cell wall biosynthesis
MKIISIGSDRNLFKEDSDVRRRIIEYGSLVDELHIIVFAKQQSQISNLKSQNFGNVFLYPTNSRSRWFYIFDAYKIGRKLASQDAQWLITAQDPFECGLAGWLVKRKFKILLHLQIHTDFLSPLFGKESFLNKIRVLLAKFLIPRADCIRVVSERIKSSLNYKFKILNSKIAVLPIYVDIKKIKEVPVKTDLHKKYPQFDFIILMASRLTREKNIGLAIKAMAEIVKKYPKTGLIIVGDGLEKENLKLSDNVILEHWSDDIVSYYKSADLFLLTSNYEGYGMAVVEAMAAECPIIMTDVGLAGEVLIDKKDGIVVPVGDKGKLTEAISNLIENKALRNRLIENSKKTLDFWPDRSRYLQTYRESWFICR